MSTQGTRLYGLAGMLVVLGLALGCNGSTVESPKASNEPGSYLFCAWNVENLFDDRDDGRTGDGDKEFDAWYPKNPHILKLKLDKLTEALLKLNDGKGPDILALIEVECVRAAELLQQALNAKLADKSLHYQHVLMKEVSVGRHIAPAILTRLPVVSDRTRLLNKRERTLQAHVKVNGHELIVIASHWTSRLGQDSDKRRAVYADTIYGAFRAMHTSNPKVDVLVCGDFNDTPEDASVVKHLHAIGDEQKVLAAQNGPYLLNLFANRPADAGYGTHYYKKWLIFDQIAVSRGMLDNEGWSCDRDSAKTINTLYRQGDKVKRPWRFGSANEKYPRGYSDHFPVTVRLSVR